MNKEKYYIFDFDETIATLLVDWNGLREEIQKRYSTYLTDEKGLKKAYIELKKNHLDFYDLVTEFESPDAKPRYTLNKKIVPFLKNNKYSVISNNVRKTIEYVLKKEDLISKCEGMVTLEECDEIKPSKQPFELLVKNNKELGNKEIIYVGDSEIDKQFSENNNIQFIHIDDFEVENENTTS